MWHQPINERNASIFYRVFYSAEVSRFEQIHQVRHAHHFLLPWKKNHLKRTLAKKATVIAFAVQNVHPKRQDSDVSITLIKLNEFFSLLQNVHVYNLRDPVVWICPKITELIF